MMTRDQAAIELNGSEYREEGSKDLWRRMKEARLVAVFGASDDLVDFDGAINDEQGASNGSKHHITRDGLLFNPCDDGCPLYEQIEARTPYIQVFWCRSEFSWEYETTIPHSVFEVFDDGAPYSRGIVFSLDDLPA